MTRHIFKTIDYLSKKEDHKYIKVGWKMVKKEQML